MSTSNGSSDCPYPKCTKPGACAGQHDHRVVGLALLSGYCQDCYHSETKRLIGEYNRKQIDLLADHVEIVKRTQVLALTGPNPAYLLTNECMCGFKTTSFLDMQAHLTSPPSDEKQHVCLRDLAAVERVRKATSSGPKPVKVIEVDESAIG